MHYRSINGHLKQLAVITRTTEINNWVPVPASARKSGNYEDDTDDSTDGGKVVKSVVAEMDPENNSPVKPKFVESDKSLFEDITMSDGDETVDASSVDTTDLTLRLRKTVKVIEV